MYPDSDEKIYSWLVRFLEGRQNPKTPLFVGISGPQGCGKSTLTAALVNLLREKGEIAETLSIDDFYLTREGQLNLAKRFPFNPFLQQRGYPGTHDIGLGLRTLEALQKRIVPLSLPRYNKSANQGQGDRFPESQWSQITQSPKVIFLEGWMLGYRPLRDKKRLDENFIQVDRMLEGYQGWYDFLDLFVHLVPEDVQFIVDWRVEAEEKMKAQGKPGMSTDEVTTYIKKFLPAYELYLPELLARPPSRMPYLKIVLQRNRMPTDSFFTAVP